MDTSTKGRHTKVLLLAALLIGATASEAALAGPRYYRHGPRIGFYVGAPLLAYSLYRPYYRPYYYSPYYYPPVAVVPPAPPVYVEQPQYQPQPIQPPVQQPAPLYQQPQQQFQPAPQPQSYDQQPVQPYSDSTEPGNVWYYCAESQAYYPYVKQCSAGWQQVTPNTRG